MLSLNSKNARTKNMSIYQLGQRKNTNAINKLIEILDSKDEEPNVRATAALALGDLEAREALKSLINALQDQNWNVRCCAAKSLGLMKSDEAVQPMGNILKRDIYYLVRINVVEALASIKGPAAINILLKVGLKDENPYVKKAVVNQFRNNIADSNLVVLPLCELLKDQDKSVREETAITLGELKNKKALTPLKKALQVKDEPVQVQQAIRGAINNINQN